MTHLLSVYTLARPVDTWASSPGAAWQDAGACIGSDPARFHPSGWGEKHAAQVADARAVCETCQVVAECLAWALDTRDGHAILGGTTPAERATILRNRQRRAKAAQRKAGA